MGMQIPRGVHSEMPEEGVVQGVAARIGDSVSAAYGATGSRDHGGAFDAGPCAHADIDSAEVLRFAGDGVHQRQERNTYCQGARWAKTELRRTAFLGARLLGIDGGEGRGCGRLEPVCSTQP